MTDPMIVDIATRHADLDPYWIDEGRRLAGELLTRTLPVRYARAKVDHPEVADWVRYVVDAAVGQRRGDVATVTAGPSLLLLGPTGTGKTHQAWGAIRALAVSGVTCRWLVSTAADIYARLRPRAGVDAETEYRTVAHAGLLVIDDLGAAKGSEWVEEINYRLINHRYERCLPTLITSNVAVRQLGAELGERVASRLTEMAQHVVLEGADRRRTRGAA